MTVFTFCDYIIDVLTYCKVERKLASRLLIIIVIWICGWTPFAIFAFMQLIGYGHSVSQNVNLLAMLICKSCSVINACLYGMR